MEANKKLREISERIRQTLVEAEPTKTLEFQSCVISNILESFLNLQAEIIKQITKNAIVHEYNKLVIAGRVYIVEEKKVYVI